jgi:hypothetical protein
MCCTGRDEVYCSGIGISKPVDSVAVDSVAGPDPDPDPYVFEPPGSGCGSISTRYGYGSFCHQAKIVKKP